MAKELNLVDKLSPEQRALQEFRMRCFSPDDGKYGETSQKLVDYLTPNAEWMQCAYVQRACLETRVEFGQAEQSYLEEVDAALGKISPVNMALLEDKVTRHDQLAVIEEIGRFVSEETKALLHPGATSYDILDTARSYLFKKAWAEVIRPEIARAIEQLCTIAEKAKGSEYLQVGRTHLQDTSPVPFSLTIAGYAARLADRVEKCDATFNGLRGKISGIVGTGAGIEMVIGRGRSIEFEKAVLAKLGLEPDYTATQIVQKERLADVGHGLVSLMHVLRDFTNDVRMLYSSAIKEVVSRDSAERLGGSSADAAKDNPIDYENMCGKTPVIEGGMRDLYEMIQSDFQRDLRGSVQARYQPQPMMVQIYESFSRLNKALPQLSVNTDKMAENLEAIRRNPSEAMVAILRGEKSWVHSQYGVGHDFVKEMSKKAKKTGRKLTEVALEDPEFKVLYDELPMFKKSILAGQIELYTGSSAERAEINLQYARKVAGG